MSFRRYCEYGDSPKVRTLSSGKEQFYSPHACNFKLLEHTFSIMTSAGEISPCLLVVADQVDGRRLNPCDARDRELLRKLNDPNGFTSIYEPDDGSYLKICNWGGVCTQMCVFREDAAGINRVQVI